ncbi:MAG: DoxX family protein [Bacteroidetes bacterium]|nr:DoxX family protein [Bacteroidota bacterium]
MKATRIIYWVSTVLVILLMLFTAIQTFAHPDHREAFARQVQFPGYMFEMLAVAKILGSVALLVPGYTRIKEWAYAGFTFDLSGALVLFAASAVPFPVTQWVPMLAGGLVLLAISYITYHRILKATTLNS